MTIELFNKNKLLCKMAEIKDSGNFLVTDSIPDVFTPFRNGLITKEALIDFLKGRVFSIGRPDKKELLSMLGLDTYDALEIAKKTHGIIMGDYCWLRFDGEEFNWEDAYEILQS